MVKVKCIRTCYMPTHNSTPPHWERFEDIEGEDVFEISEDKITEFVASGNFQAI